MASSSCRVLSLRCVLLGEVPGHELEDLVDEDDGQGERGHHLPLGERERRDLEDGLRREDSIREIREFNGFAKERNANGLGLAF